MDWIHKGYVWVYLRSYGKRLTHDDDDDDVCVCVC